MHFSLRLCTRHVVSDQWVAFCCSLYQFIAMWDRYLEQIVSYFFQGAGILWHQSAFYYCSMCFLFFVLRSLLFGFLPHPVSFRGCMPASLVRRKAWFVMPRQLYGPWSTWRRSFFIWSWRMKEHLTWLLDVACSLCLHEGRCFFLFFSCRKHVHVSVVDPSSIGNYIQ